MSSVRGAAPLGKQPNRDFVLIGRNAIGAHRSRRCLQEDNIPLCNCGSPELDTQGCGERCLNRLLSTECVRGFCRQGPACQNQRLQHCAYASFRLADMGSKGMGLQATALILEGTLVTEYIGEVVNRKEAHRRALAYQAARQRHTYIMTLSPEEVIDATQKGGYARYINHSCSPNCRAEKWLVAGEICIAIVTLRDVQPDEELTYDYKLQEQHNSKRVRCECGAAKCRGYLGTASRHRSAVCETSDHAAWDECSSESDSQAGDHDDFSSESDADVQQPSAQHVMPAVPTSSTESLQISNPASCCRSSPQHAHEGESQQWCTAQHVPLAPAALSGDAQVGQACRPERLQACMPQHADRCTTGAASCNTPEVDTSVSIGSYGADSLPGSPAHCSGTALLPARQDEQRPADPAQLISEAHATPCQADQLQTQKGGQDYAASMHDPLMDAQQPAYGSQVKDRAGRDKGVEQLARAIQASSRLKQPGQIMHACTGPDEEVTHDPAEVAWFQLPWCHYHVEQMLQSFESSYWTLATCIATHT